MKIIVIKSKSLDRVYLPENISGDFWVKHYNSKGVEVNLVNICAKDGSWVLSSNNDVIILSGNERYQNVILKEYNFYQLEVAGEERVVLYCLPSLEKNVIRIGVTEGAAIKIGKAETNNIVINHPLLLDYCFSVALTKNNWTITDINQDMRLYVNDKLVSNSLIKFGDVLFLMGIKIVLMKDFILIESPQGIIKFLGNMFQNLPQKEMPNGELDYELVNVELYKESEFFYSSPRLKTSIEPVTVRIDPPPQKMTDTKRSALLTYGPMLTMGAVSAFSLINALNNITTGAATWSQSMPSIIMGAAMLMSMIGWPLLTNGYEKRNRSKNEKNRQKKYQEYLKSKRDIIIKNIEKQTRTLNDNFPALEECYSIINNRKNRLWEKKIIHEDFMELRVGLGRVPLAAKIDFEQEGFTMETDDLKELVYKLIDETKFLENVPITFPFALRNVVSILASMELSKSFVDGLILQMTAFHSYEDLKIVFLTTEQNKDNWEYIKELPHCWDDNKTIRYFATNPNEIREVTFHLAQIIHSRKYESDGNRVKEKKEDYKSHRPYYVILTDDFKTIKDLEVIKSILAGGVNVGFSLITISEKLANTPNTCKNFLYIDRNMSGIFQDELSNNKQQDFSADFLEGANLSQLFTKMSNIPIEFSTVESNLPNILGFLEMFDVGRVEQLNIFNRWQNNDATLSLQAPVGISKSGDLLNLDLHEKYHGPHGLIAGMTGSGKSEFIITYILSMALNYHPNEVSFVLIDYKGGGLTGAFENREKGIKLPHLAGTITNLDTIEMNRALTSIQSELRKRQRIFNEVRDRLGESTIDIYKYQKLFREGQVEVPIPHLFIISDEFAELKMQQPEFMSQLISTARIGRSLGVHLILATQKPSGIVDDQIWSNSRFRVCFKVQEKSDSTDVIKRGDAADLKQVGRFYLQVGFNEFFDLGQAAWGGKQYIPADRPEKKVDNSLTFIDNVGNVIKSIDDSKKLLSSKSMGEEVTNVLSYIIEAAKTQNVTVSQLWLDRIPDEIFVKDLMKKYKYTVTRNEINPVIGEYDDPFNQRQGLLTLPLTKEGNTIIYGMAGSGKENLLTTLICSTIATHNANEVNFYILDLGSETFKMFASASQVGDVVLSFETEKIINLFKMLRNKIEERKKILTEFGGSINLYNAKNDKPMPLIVTIINNYDAFAEMFDDLSDSLAYLTREGSKFGIIFIITTGASMGIRYKLQQNFSQSLVLQFNEKNDYSNILGNTEGVYPSKIVGRGIVKLDGIYEFQTALVEKPHIIMEYIKQFSEKIRENSIVFAEKIPILPEVVTHSFVEPYINNLSNVPIGVNKNNLNVTTYDFLKNKISVITAYDIMSTIKFVKGLINVFISIPDNNVFLMDSDDYFKDQDLRCKYINNDFKNMIISLTDKMKNEIENKVSQEKKPHITLILMGTEKLVKDVKNINIFTALTNLATEYKRVSIILVDSFNGFKQHEYNDWFRPINMNNGIWIGNGANDQFLIKVSKNINILKEDINDNFAFVIKRGDPELVKVLSDE